MILLYDKLVEKRILVKPTERKYIQHSVENSIKWFLKAGLKEEYTEFLTESVLWSFIKFDHFAEIITTLSHLCRFDNKWAEKGDIISFIIENLCEIYYEHIIGCDIVLTGDIDVQLIWKTLRLEILDKEILPHYVPPIVLSFPTLNGMDGQPLSTSKDDNSLSIKHTNEELRKRIDEADETFLDMLYDYLIIPSKKYDHGYTDFISTKKDGPLEEKRNRAYNYISEYFNKIRR